MNLQDKTVVVSGASRGIGKSIALAAARQKANVVILAKTERPHPKLSGTIHTTADEVQKLGGNALPIKVDLRIEEQVQDAIQATINAFGQIDALINNASALYLAKTEQMPMKRFDLVHQVNVRATFMLSKYCIPYLKKSDNAHILNISPPLNIEAKWFKDFLGYSLSKFGMSLCALGMAEELKAEKIAVNCLWPQTTIATAAIQNVLGGEAMMRRSRKPEIMADAALKVLEKKATDFSGNFLVDEDFLRSQGVQDFAQYAVDSSKPLEKDFFVD